MRSKLLFAAALAVLLLLTRPADSPAKVAAIAPVPHSSPHYDTQGAAAQAVQMELGLLAQAEADAQAEAERVKPIGTAGAQPSATSPPAPAPSGDPLEAIAKYFPQNYDSAVRVADCESSLNPDAVSSGGGNWGLFQINTVHSGTFEEVTGHSWSEVNDPYLNAQFAAWLYNQNGGWGPWACRWAA